MGYVRHAMTSTYWDVRQWDLNVRHWGLNVRQWEGSDVHTLNMTSLLVVT